MKRKKITIGLFGFGCVGSGLYEVLQLTPKLNASVKRICVKNPTKERSLPPENFIFDPSMILNDDEINVVVELIDDAEVAFEIVKAALMHGKAVVTANKKMIACHFEELLFLQHKFRVPLLYEAACCASIPVIRNLEEYYDNDLLVSVEGIVNGSTNYILSKIRKEKSTFKYALGEAQRLGFAESNPDLDIKGLDAKYKLVLLLAHAFGLVVKPGDIYNLGIDRIGNAELEYAEEKGLKIKLLAVAARNSHGNIQAFVLPAFIEPEDKLYSVEDVFNGVRIMSCFADSQFFEGRGAGSHPTASAVISDISALSYGYRYEYKKLDNDEVLQDQHSVHLKLMIRCNKEILHDVMDYFLWVDEYKLTNNEGYVIGITTLKTVSSILEQYPESSAILFDDQRDVKFPADVRLKNIAIHE
jgi:homoserine dehydrogenase